MPKYFLIILPDGRDERTDERKGSDGPTAAEKYSFTVLLRRSLHCTVLLGRRVVVVIMIPMLIAAVVVAAIVSVVVVVAVVR